MDCEIFRTLSAVLGKEPGDGKQNGRESVQSVRSLIATVADQVILRYAQLPAVSKFRHE
uniref:Uncharacterized protein n=1 Tax=Anguilla anguilla TaxID=7936 RepID=A0A0E9V7T3_ANGAN